MARRKFPKSFKEVCFGLGALLFFIYLIPIARLLDFVIDVNPLGLCVGGLGFASLGVIAHEGRVNDRALLYMLILWICGFIVWASIR